MTRISAQEANFNAIKQQLIQEGFPDVHIRRSFSRSMSNWMRTENYVAVSANDPLAHDFMLAVGHERVDEAGKHHRLNLAMEWTNPTILSHIPWWYEKLGNYYYLLRTRGRDEDPDKNEFPDMSERFRTAVWNVEAAAENFLQKAYHDRTMFIIRIEDYMRQKNLRFFRINNDWQVMKPVEFTDEGTGRRVTVDTAFEPFCSSVKHFLGHLNTLSAAWMDGVQRFGQATLQNFEVNLLAELKGNTRLPTLTKDDRWVALANEGWFYICDDPHNPDGIYARKRIRYLREFSCQEGEACHGCDRCLYYCNLPYYFPLPNRMWGEEVSRRNERGEIVETETVFRKLPSLFLYAGDEYRGHVEGEVGELRSVSVFVKTLLLNKGCYYVSRKLGHIHQLDKKKDSWESNDRAGAPVHWLSAVDVYRPPPCKHKWFEERGNAAGWFNCVGGTDPACGERRRGHPVAGDRWEKPDIAARASWGEVRYREFMECIRRIFQLFVTRDKVLVIEGPPATGKSLLIAPFAPAYDDRSPTLFPMEDIMQLGTGAADKMGGLKENTRLAWLNEYDPETLKVDVFKVFAEGLEFFARGMRERSSWQAARLPKLVSLNYKKFKKYGPNGEYLGEFYDRDPWKTYDDSGAVKDRLEEFRAEIYPKELKKEMLLQVQREGIAILVHTVDLRFIPYVERHRWRKGGTLTVTRLEERNRSMRESGEGDDGRPPPPPPKKRAAAKKAAAGKKPAAAGKPPAGAHLADEPTWVADPAIQAASDEAHARRVAAAEEGEEDPLDVGQELMHVVTGKPPAAPLPKGTTISSSASGLSPMSLAHGGLLRSGGTFDFDPDEEEREFTAEISRHGFFEADQTNMGPPGA